jgi:putative flippase GtrA
LRIIALAQQNRKEFVRFLKFMVVGTIGAVVDFGILNALKLAFRAYGVDLGMWHLFGGLAVEGNLTLANTISFTSAVISNFTWNRFWTYPESRTKPLGGQLGQFFVVNIAGLAINLTVLNALDPLFKPWLGFYSYNAAKAVATIIVMFWNYGVNRFWTYNDVKLGQ